MGGNQGHEWNFVKELIHYKHTLHVRCKSCGHEFHGSATQIKEHLFKVNVVGCANPPPNLSTKFYKYSSKLKANPLLKNPQPNAMIQYLKSKGQNPQIFL